MGTGQAGRFRTESYSGHEAGNGAGGGQLEEALDTVGFQQGVMSPGWHFRTTLLYGARVELEGRWEVTLEVKVAGIRVGVGEG